MASRFKKSYDKMIEPDAPTMENKSGVVDRDSDKLPEYAFLFFFVDGVGLSCGTRFVHVFRLDFGTVDKVATHSKLVRILTNESHYQIHPKLQQTTEGMFCFILWNSIV